MDARYPVWSGAEWLELPAAESGGEVVVVPNVAALVYRSGGRGELLLQRRDKPGEAVRGRLELPGGRWRAGEAPDAAIAREVAEETGVSVLAVSGAIEHRSYGAHIAFRIGHPVAVVNGVEGAYPSMHVLYECVGWGTPTSVPGETTEPSWWPVDDVLERLRDHPDDFVWHTRAMLEAYFGI